MSRSRRPPPAKREKFTATFDWSCLAGRSLLLALATSAVYALIVWHPFINYDDDDYILNNPNIRQGVKWTTVTWAFSHVYAANWHPLTWLVHAFDFQLYGESAGGHHATSLLL